MTSSIPILQHPVRTIGIVGGGIAGVLTAKTLRQAGFHCEIFERGDRLGGVWTAGYHSAGLQTPRGFYNLPDWPMPDHYPDMPSAAQLQAYVEDYARHFGVDQHVHLQHRIERLSERSDGPGWTIEYTADGARGSRSFDYLVMATGLYANPFVPSLPGREQFAGEVLHSSEYRHPDQVRGRKVVVVGFGKSALDVAVDAARHDADVSLVFREAHWPVPVKLFGRVDIRKLFMNRLASAFLPLYQRPGRWEARLHRHAPWLVRGFWRAVEAAVDKQFGLAKSNALPTTSFANDLFSGGILPTDDTYPRLRDGSVTPVCAGLDSYTATGLRLTTGQTLDADVVVFGTGWRRDDSLLPAPLRSQIEGDGVYLYRHILSPELANLAFIGWASTFSNSLTSHLGAVWLAHVLTGRVSLPSADAMRAEIADMKRWKRGFIPAMGCRGSMLQLHMWNFHDDLLRDMGVEPRRKRSLIAELLSDYSPADYAELFTDDHLRAPATAAAPTPISAAATTAG